MAIKAAKQGDTLVIEMTGIVGDGWSDNPITSKAVGKVLKDNPDAKLIRVPVNSPGGNMFEGLQIYQMLVDHPARVEIVIGAEASSAMSLIAMSGDRVEIHETSLFLVHNPWTLTIGNYIEHEKAAKELQMMADVLAGAYAKRTGMSKEAAQSLMDEDRYMNAEEAKKLGFADAIIESKKKEQALNAADARAQMMRSRSHAMSRVMQTAAAALYQPIETPVPSAPAETEKTHDMAQLAVILAALCLADGVSDAEATAIINGLRAAKDSNGKLLEALGAKSEADALGRIEGLKGADERAAKAEAELNKISAETAKSKHDALIAGALDPKSSSPHAGKLTPAQKAWAEGVSTETLEGFLAVAPAITKGDGKSEPKSKISGYTGKPYADLTNDEKHELATSDPELFKQLRDASSV